MRSLRQMTSDLESWAREKPETRTERLRFASHLAGLGLFTFSFADPNSVKEWRLDDPDPMPARLGDWIEERARYVHSPWRKPAKAGTTYMIPNWLLRTRKAEDFKKLPGLRAWMRHGLPANTRVSFPMDSRPVPMRWLRYIILRRQSMNAQRRETMLGRAKWILDCLKGVLGYDPVRSTWLAEMIEEPVEFERRALSSVWNSFVREFNRPASLLLRRNRPSLQLQLRLEKGCEGGAHRRSFAEQQPWAAISLISSLTDSYTSSELDEIDRNPANGLLVAARHLCYCPSCVNPCPTALNLARYLPRLRRDPSFDDILGKQGGGYHPVPDYYIRRILMRAHAQDGSELISHMRDGRTVVRSQIALAYMLCRHFLNSREVTYETSLDTAALLARMMIRDRFVDPGRLQPDVVGDALLALSADALAAYAEDRSDLLPGRRREDWEPLRSLDAGLRAFVRFVGSTRKPRLTTRQLIRLSEQRTRNQTPLFQVPEWHDTTIWPIVPQLSETCRRLGSEGDAMVPLASVVDVNGEGRTMRNCLRHQESYVQELVLGRIAIVSVRSARGKRATLMLRPLLAQQGGESQIQRWTMSSFLGPGNSSPRRSCRRLVKRLVEELDAQCPIRIPQSEIRRRLDVSSQLRASRAINRDKTVAEDIWREFYLRALPRRLSKWTPRKIVASYYESP